MALSNFCQHVQPICFVIFFWIVKEHHLLKFMFEREEPDVSRMWAGRGEERERKKGFRQGGNIWAIT